MKIYFDGILSSIIQNSVFGFIIFALFSGTIDRWLGHDVTESARFNPKRFLKNIKESTDNVIIQETFIRLLVQNHKVEFVEALKVFFDNHSRKYPDSTKYEGNIRILVLHPFGKAIRKRHQELRGHIQGDQKKFLLLTRDLLGVLKDIQKEVNKYAAERMPEKAGYFFEIRISYKKPKFSFYYCDKYASVSYYANEPCEDAPQLIFHRDKERMNPVAEKHKVFFEHDWDRGILLTNTYFSLAFSRESDPEKFKHIVNKFKAITKSTIPQTITENLKSISDVCKNNAVFALELINYIEIHHRKKNINFISSKPKPHFSILGTGGDSKENRTINISTIVSILASHLTKIDGHDFDMPIIKVGTLAVTGKVGSQTFYETLQSKTIIENNGNSGDNNLIPQEKKIFLDYNKNNKSAFLPIIYFGYMYRQLLRNARKDFIEDNNDCIDIFKIIFPLANLTGYQASINGVSKEPYLQLYAQIYEFKQKTGIVLRNDREIDELFHGQNTIIYYKKGREIYRYTKRIKVKDVDSYYAFFKEYESADYGDEHVERFFQLFRPNSNITEDIKITICYNIALFVQLNFLMNNDYPKNEKKKAEEAFGEPRLHSLMGQIKKFYFD